MELDCQKLPEELTQPNLVLDQGSSTGILERLLHNGDMVFFDLILSF